MTFESLRSSVVVFFLCVSPVISLAEEEMADYEHFIGTYAFEATPYWPEFEIIKDSNGFMLQVPNSDWQMALKESDGTLVAKEDDGDEFKFSFDASHQHYIMSSQYQSGSQRISKKDTLIKHKSNPNDELEKEYGVKAADLVQRVRGSEEWIHQVKSFQVKAKDKETLRQLA